MAPLAAPKAFVLSTLWGVAATSSAAPPVVLASGKLWTIDVRNQITWVV